MKKSKEEKEQEKIAKKIAKANKKLGKKETAYQKALESGNDKKITKAAQKLAKAQTKYEKEIGKIEEKYGISLHDESPQSTERSPQYAPGTTDVYGNLLQTEPKTNSKEQHSPQEESQPSQTQQQQSTGDPFVDMIMRILELAMEMKRQRLEAEINLTERIFGLKKDKSYQPLYQTATQTAQTAPVNTNTQNNTPSMTPEQIAFMLQMKKSGRI